MVQVFFALDPSEWHGSASEAVEASDLGGSRYRLEGTPFHALEVSAADVVTARLRDGALWFEQVAQRGGHSTYRLMIEDPDQFDEHWAPLQALGCTCEEEEQLVAIDVPPSADIYQVYQRLEDGAEAGAWDFEEGHVGHEVE